MMQKITFLENEIKNFKTYNKFFIQKIESVDVENILKIANINESKTVNIIDKSKPNLLWVTDFPLFEYDNEEERYVAKHHPFTSPKVEDLEYLEKDPQKVHARAYDLVLNGNEVGGGSIRINNPEMQERMLNALGFSKEEAEERFGFLIESFKYGAPPHGGLAFGLDRLVMLMLGCDSIREVIAFPKNKRARDLLMRAPSVVSEQQLKDVHIKLDLDENK